MPTVNGNSKDQRAGRPVPDRGSMPIGQAGVTAAEEKIDIRRSQTVSGLHIVRPVLIKIGDKPVAVVMDAGIWKTSHCGMANRKIMGLIMGHPARNRVGPGMNVRTRVVNL